MNDFAATFDLVTGVLWLALAVVGIALRLKRLARLQRIVLVDPTDGHDELYLHQIKVSTYLRLGVKCVLLIGALIAVFDLGGLWWAWRLGVCLMLALMIWETTSVDHIRGVLGRTAREPVTGSRLQSEGESR